MQANGAKKIGVISLGCDKNRVDTEKMLAVIAERHQIVSDPASADVIIINTCAFLNSARKEAIEEVIAAAEYKKTGNKKIIVTGCLPQKFIGEIYSELKEADGFTGISDYGRINEVIDRVCAGERVNAVGRHVLLRPAAVLGLAFYYEEVGLRAFRAHHLAAILVDKGDGFQFASVPEEHPLDVAVAYAERISLHSGIALRPRLARTQNYSRQKNHG